MDADPKSEAPASGDEASESEASGLQQSGPGEPGANADRPRWLMKLATILLALAPFVMLELGLKLWLPEKPIVVGFDPIVDLDEAGPLFELDRDGKRWEIPAERFNFFQPDSFLANKPIGSRRIFVLGGSTVQGRPYSIETSFAKWLQLRLESASPDTTFEIVNCGGVSYASYRVAKVLEEILEHQPDAVVVYTGHNEFLEDREYADVREMSETRRWFARVASKIETVQWIRGQLASRSGRPNTVVPPHNAMSGEVDARLDHVGGLDRYHRDPKWRSAVEEHFADTLRRIVLATQQREIPLVLCAPTSDVVATPPFKIEPAPDMPPSRQLAFANAWKVARDTTITTEERLSGCTTGLEIDPEHAGMNFIAGQLLYHDHQPALAVRYLNAARDFDVCPLRATSPIVQAVIKVAANSGVPLVRTDRLLDRRDSNGKRIADGIPEPEFFVDHLHPTVAGHQRIAAALAEEIEKLGWYTRSPNADETYQRSVDAHLQTLGEEYYARGRQRLEGLRRWASGRAGKLVETTSTFNAVD